MPLETRLNESPGIKVEQGGLVMDLELSYLCNLECKGCFTKDDREKEPTKKLTFEQLKEIIDQAAEAGFATINLIGGGEPLLYRDSGKDIFDVIDYVKSKGIEVELFTNGLSVTKDAAVKLSERNVTAVVKLNSLDPEVCYKLTGNGKKQSGRYLKAENWVEHSYSDGETVKIPVWIEHLIDAYQNNENAQLCIETLLFRENYDSIPALWRFCRDDNLVPSFEKCAERGDGKNVDLLAEEETTILFGEIRDIDRREYGYDWQLIGPYMGEYGCHLSGNVILVKANGKVQPCEGVAVELGNVLYGDQLKDILQNPTFKRLQEIRNSGYCSGCTHYSEGKSPCMGAMYDKLGEKGFLEALG